MKRVLITDANQRSALAVTRSLGMNGIPVVAADETPESLAGHSRYSLEYARYPSPATSPDDFFTSISDLCAYHRIDIIIPMTEITATLLLSNCDALHGIRLPLMDLETVNHLTDKCRLTKLAQTLDIPVPVTVFASTNTELNHDLPLPLVLKPGKSWVKFENRWIHTAVRIAKSHAVAGDILATSPDFRAGDFMLQDYIPGHGAGVFAIYNKGKPLAIFAHRRLREKPPRGGVSVLSESVQVDPLLEQYTRKLLDHVGWHGVAMVEFRISSDGVPFLMEINTRFWGSLQLAVDSGVDFPLMLYQMTCDESVSPVTSYKTGKRLRWLLGDIDSLYLLLRDPGFSNAEKFRAVFDFMKPSPFRTRHEVNRLGDMGPFWWELKQYIRDLIK